MLPNSGIPNLVFYLVALKLGGYAWEQAGVIWYQTLKQLSPHSNFQNCADITTQVAGARFGTGSLQQKAVISAWEEVGIQISQPEPVVATRRPAYSFTGNGSELKQRIRGDL